MSHPSIKVVDCATAEEFIDAISPVGPRFGGFGADDWLFRGQDRDVYPLVPSALRVTRPLEKVMGSSIQVNSEQIFAEQKTLRDFFELADRRGLTMPDDSQALRAAIERYCSADYSEKEVTTGEHWPPLDLLSLIGLAQHYGVPTRLLDWTYNPFVAAFFAALGAWKHWNREAEMEKERDRARQEMATSAGMPDLYVKPGPDVVFPPADEKLVVWALSAVSYRMRRSWHGRGRVELVTVPYASNPNIRAQQGLFTVHRPEKIDPFGDVDRRPLDEILCEDLAPVAKFKGKDMTLMMRITMPTSRVPRLFFLLEKLGINESAIYPGLEGVARTLIDQPFRKMHGVYGILGKPTT